MSRNLYCNVLGSSLNVQNLVSKIFAKNCKRLVSKVSCLISVSERSSLGLVSSFCSKSRSRRFWLRRQLCYISISTIVNYRNWRDASPPFFLTLTQFEVQLESQNEKLKLDSKPKLAELKLANKSKRVCFPVIHSAPPHQPIY